ncbi:MAG: hypothetical protein U9Q17_02460, partial [Chloroflexota bacterium]|nr:hypothetical protein [Chloroflexota bacterium]
LKTMVTARGLEALLLGKEVTTSDGLILGEVAAIKKELGADKIWMVVDGRGREDRVPIEQIASVASKVVLFNGLCPGRAADGALGGWKEGCTMGAGR